MQTAGLIAAAASALTLYASTGAAQPDPAARATPGTAARQPVQASDALRMRAEQMPDLFNGKRALKDFFVPDIPADQFNRVIAQVRERMGAALSVSDLTAVTPNNGLVTVQYERGQRRMRLRVTDDAPHLVDDFGSAG